MLTPSTSVLQVSKLLARRTSISALTRFLFVINSSAVYFATTALNALDKTGARIPMAI